MVKPIREQGRELLRRSADQHLRIAVTGLSGCGKTTFVTSLIHALLGKTSYRHLPLWQVANSGRLLGVRQQSYETMLIPEFPYQKSIQQLAKGIWPASTDGLNEVRLVLSYRPGTGLRQKLTNRSQLVLDIFDYPGEWLLDLPLLDLSYEAWSEQICDSLSEPLRAKLAKPWQSELLSINPHDIIDDERAVDIAQAYKTYLHSCRTDLGLNYLQPGRFLLPAELEGAPVLNFFPWVLTPPQSETSHDSWYQTLKRRYDYYREHVIKPFYRDHFRRFDRQIVLVDLLGALNQGPLALQDMQEALSQALESFRYGERGVLRRMFAPQIDKVLFAASQSDRVTAEQHSSMTELLARLLRGPMANLNFEGLSYQTMALSALRATVQGDVVHKGGQVPALQGMSLDECKPIRLFPGSVPNSPPDPDFWLHQGFDFACFAPPPITDDLPHIRLDAALQYLIGDKLK